MATAADESHPTNADDMFAGQWRDHFASLFGDGGPVAGRLNELEVYADSTGMQVKVRTGYALILGQSGKWGSETILPIAAADPTNPRKDLVVVRNAFPVAGTNELELDVITGTPAGSPTLPTVTNDAVKAERALAGVDVAAAASTIDAGDVYIDLRAFYYPPLPGGHDIQKQTFPVTGDLVNVTNATSIQTFDVVKPAGWNQFDVDLRIEVFPWSDTAQRWSFLIQNETPTSLAVRRHRFTGGGAGLPELLTISTGLVGPYTADHTFDFLGDPDTATSDLTIESGILVAELHRTR